MTTLDQPDIIFFRIIESIHPIGQTLIFTGMNVLTTIIGASVVFIFTCITSRMYQSIKDKITVILFGCGSGVMLSASIFGLLNPAKEILCKQYNNLFAMILLITGFILGIVIMWFFDAIVHFIIILEEKINARQVIDKELANEEFESSFKIPTEDYLGEINEGLKIEEQTEDYYANTSLLKPKENSKLKFKKIVLLIIAMMLHNLPDGLLIGTAFAAVASKTLHFGNALLLSVSIGLQNIPEGAAVALPCQREGIPALVSFLLGSFSAISEPIGGLIGLQLTFLSSSILPYLLTFSAGSMCFVVFNEMLPVIFKVNRNNKCNNRKYGIVGMLFGFITMMAIDILLE